jgi:hypothetical protein
MVYLWRRGRADIEEAMRLFSTALSIDLESTTALSGMAFSLCWVYLFGWSDNIDAVRARALEAARHAVTNDDSDAWAHAILGWSYLRLGHLTGRPEFPGRPALAREGVRSETVR